MNRLYSKLKQICQAKRSHAFLTMETEESLSSLYEHQAASPNDTSVFPVTECRDNEKYGDENEIPRVGNLDINIPDTQNSAEIDKLSCKPVTHENEVEVKEESCIISKVVSNERTEPGGIRPEGGEINAGKLSHRLDNPIIPADSGDEHSGTYDQKSSDCPDSDSTEHKVIQVPSTKYNHDSTEHIEQRRAETSVHPGTELLKFSQGTEPSIMQRRAETSVHPGTELLKFSQGTEPSIMQRRAETSVHPGTELLLSQGAEPCKPSGIIQRIEQDTFTVDDIQTPDKEQSNVDRSPDQAFDELNTRQSEITVSGTSEPTLDSNSCAGRLDSDNNGNNGLSTLQVLQPLHSGNRLESPEQHLSGLVDKESSRSFRFHENKPDDTVDGLKCSGLSTKSSDDKNPSLSSESVAFSSSEIKDTVLKCSGPDHGNGVDNGRIPCTLSSESSVLQNQSATDSSCKDDVTQDYSGIPCTQALFDSFSIQFEDEINSSTRKTVLKRKHDANENECNFGEVTQPVKKLRTESSELSDHGDDTVRPVQIKKRRKKRRSADFSIVNSSSIIQSPTLNEEELQALSSLPVQRRSSRLRRKSLTLYRKELKKSVELAKEVFSLEDRKTDPPADDETIHAAQQELNLEKPEQTVSELFCETDNTTVTSPNHVADVQSSPSWNSETVDETKYGDIASESPAIAGFTDLVKETLVEEPIGFAGTGSPKEESTSSEQEGHSTKPGRRSSARSGCKLSASQTSSTDSKPVRRGRKTKTEKSADSDKSVEEIYLNKLWKTQMPTQKVWETIYEHPRKAHNGSESYLSKQRQKRCLNLEEVSVAKIKKRHQRAVKRGWKRPTKKVQESCEQKLCELLSNLEEATESADMNQV